MHLLTTCRLFCDEVWSAHDVSVRFFHNHNVRIFHIERDTNPNAEIHRFVVDPWHDGSWVPVYVLIQGQFNKIAAYMKVV